MVGTLKGFDQLMNVVLDDVKEIMRGMQQATAFCGQRAHCFKTMKATKLPDRSGSLLLAARS